MPEKQLSSSIVQCAEFTSHSAEDVVDLFIQVFSESESTAEGQAIGDLVSQLITTTEKNAVYGFTASENETIVGCVFFSRFILPKETPALILSPAAVATKHQNNGIGQALIKQAIQILKNKGIEILLVYGDPNYYSKFGFQQISQATIRSPFALTYPQGWQAFSLNEESLRPLDGETQCVEALRNDKFW